MNTIIKNNLIACCALLLGIIPAYAQNSDLPDSLNLIGMNITALPKVQAKKLISAGSGCTIAKQTSVTFQVTHNEGMIILKPGFIARGGCTFHAFVGDKPLLHDDLSFVETERNLSKKDSEEVVGIPNEFDLEQNYPNPFNPSTTINFSLPKAAQVMLKVYDIVGREVATLVDGKLPAGFHNAIFEPKNLPSGTYFYRMQAEGFTQTRKLMLTK